MPNLNQSRPESKLDNERALDVRVGDLLTRFVELLDQREPPKPDSDVEDRSGAAKYLRISLSKLDQLCRRETDPIPFHLCGDSRRFLRSELRSWLERQGR
jgi:hypothetical protein